jgi:hypothetical protein
MFTKNIFFVFFYNVGFKATSTFAYLDIAHDDSLVVKDLLELIFDFSRKFLLQCDKNFTIFCFIEFFCLNFTKFHSLVVNRCRPNQIDTLTT